jgi:hypothetical protein
MSIGLGFVRLKLNPPLSLSIVMRGLVPRIHADQQSPSSARWAWTPRNTSTAVRFNSNVEFAARNVIHHEDTKNTKRAEHWPRFRLLFGILRALESEML